MNKIISTDQAPKAIGPYSQAVYANGTLYVSGQLPLIPETGQLAQGIASQTEQALKNIQAILTEAKFTLADVVKTTVLMKDLSQFAEMNEVYARFFTTKYPARATYQVAKLPLDALIEIECIAHRKCD